MAYYAAFSFFPLLLVALAGLGFALQFSSGAQNAEQELLQLVAKNIAEPVAKQVGELLSGVRTNAKFTGPLGLVTLLFGAIAIFTQLDYAFDRLWRVANHHGHGILGALRRALGARLKAFVILTSLGLAIITTFALGITMATIRTWASQWRAGSLAWQWGEALAVILFHALIFTVLYKTLPKAKVRLSDAFIGGMCVAIVWEIGREVMSYIIVGKAYTPYGVVGSFIAIMVWVYYASSLLFFGAQLVQVLGNPNQDNANERNSKS